MKTITYALLAIIFLSSFVAQASCLSKAAIRWNVPEIILEAIIQQESSGRPEALNLNKNGSYDYGLMQINSINFESLKSLGIITHEKMLMQPCINIQAGAYLLSQKFNKYGYSWRAVGAYHSETPHYRDNYANKIMKIVQDTPTLPVKTTSLLASSTTF